MQIFLVSISSYLIFLLISIDNTNLQWIPWKLKHLLLKIVR